MDAPGENEAPLEVHAEPTALWLRLLLAVGALLTAGGVAGGAGFMGVLMMAFAADGASGKDVARVEWTFTAYMVSMGIVAASGLLFAPAIVARKKVLAFAGVALLVLGGLGGLGSFVVYAAAIVK